MQSNMAFMVMLSFKTWQRAEFKRKRQQISPKQQIPSDLCLSLKPIAQLWQVKAFVCPGGHLHTLKTRQEPGSGQAHPQPNLGARMHQQGSFWGSSACLCCFGHATAIPIPAYGLPMSMVTNFISGQIWAKIQREQPIKKVTAFILNSI